MLHEILLFLAARGHQVQVAVSGSYDGPSFEGIPVVATADSLKADIVVTHLDQTRTAVRYANGRPVIHLVHNHRQLAFHEVDDAALVVANSGWIHNEVVAGHRWARGKTIVVYPPVPPDRYRVETSREWVVLVNCYVEKGPRLFAQLARLMPYRRFLAVKGCYGTQERMPTLPNLTVWEHQRDIRRVYERAGVVVMPSSYESWGRVAVEAACSGIPLVVASTPGLVEAVGEAAQIVPTTNLEGWAKAIESAFTDPEWGERAYRRAAELWAETNRQLAVLEARLLAL